MAVMLFEAEAKSSIQHILCPAAAAAACVLQCVWRGCFSVLTTDDTLVPFLGLPGRKRLQNEEGKEGKASCACVEGHGNLVTGTTPWDMQNRRSGRTV